MENRKNRKAAYKGKRGSGVRNIPQVLGLFGFLGLSGFIGLLCLLVFRHPPARLRATTKNRINDESANKRKGFKL